MSPSVLATLMQRLLFTPFIRQPGFRKSGWDLSILAGLVSADNNFLMYVTYQTQWYQLPFTLIVIARRTS